MLNAMLTSGVGVLKTREEKVRNPKEGLLKARKGGVLTTKEGGAHYQVGRAHY